MPYIELPNPFTHDRTPVFTPVLRERPLLTLPVFVVIYISLTGPKDTDGE